jgi:hypothetical protein
VLAIANRTPVRTVELRRIMKIRLPDSGGRLAEKSNLQIGDCSRLLMPGGVPTDREGEV